MLSNPISFLAAAADSKCVSSTFINCVCLLTVYMLRSTCRNCVAVGHCLVLDHMVLAPCLRIPEGSCVWTSSWSEPGDYTIILLICCHLISERLCALFQRTGDCSLCPLADVYSASLYQTGTPPFYLLGDKNMYNFQKNLNNNWAVCSQASSPLLV